MVFTIINSKFQYLLTFFSSFVDSSSECSPKFKKSQVATPSSSRGVLDSSNVHEESHYSTTSNAAIKPISLASRFDCFSDSD